MHAGIQPAKPATVQIKSSFVKHAVAIQKLWSLTSLPRIQLLTFWADISTFGDDSFYAQLFLQHDIVGMYPVFAADDNGNYLQDPKNKLSDHYPAIMAALQMNSASYLTMIIQSRNLSDELNISNLSIIYRYVLFANVLSISIPNLFRIIPTLTDPLSLEDPFTSPERTYNALTLWNQVLNSGFTFDQLAYILTEIDDPKEPLQPTKLTTLTNSKTLYDGLTAINVAHPDMLLLVASNLALEEDFPFPISPPNSVLDDAFVSSELALIFDPTTVSSIVALLNGTTTYTAIAGPQLSITIPSDLSKVHYTKEDPGTLQITGILTPYEKYRVLSLSISPEWADAVTKIGDQPGSFFDQTLSSLFSDNSARAVVKASLLAGDVPIQHNQITLLSTAPRKRQTLLHYLEPILRNILSTQLIVSTMSSFSSLPSDMTQVFLQDVLTVSSGGVRKSALDYIREIAPLQPAVDTNGWKGYLVPPSTDNYTFIVTSEQSVHIQLNGTTYLLIEQNDRRQSDPIPLVAGTLYSFGVFGKLEASVEWQSARSPQAAIPSSALLPQFAVDSTTSILRQTCHSSDYCQ